MKTKIAAVAAAVLAAILLALPAVLPATYSASSELEIPFPAEKVYNHLNNLDHWNEWSGMHADAEGLEYFFPLTKQGQGSIMQWVGKDTSGQLVFDALEKNKKIEYNIYIDSDRDSKGSLKLEEVNGVTRLGWEVSGKLPYFRRYAGLFYGSRNEKQMAAALLRLQGLLGK